MSRDLNSQRASHISNTLALRITSIGELPKEDSIVSQIYSPISKIQVERLQTTSSQFTSVEMLLKSFEEEPIVAGEIPSITFQFIPKIIV